MAEKDREEIQNMGGLLSWKSSELKTRNHPGSKVTLSGSTTLPILLIDGIPPQVHDANPMPFGSSDADID